MNENEVIVNRVKARGRFLGCVQNTYGYNGITVFIRNNSSRPRRNAQNENEGRNRRLRAGEANGTYVHFSFGTGFDMPKDINPQDTVYVEGHVEARVVKNQLWEGRSSYIQYMVVDKIRKAETQLEEAFPGLCTGKGFSYPSPFIDIALMGEITNITKSNHNAADGSNADRVWTRIRLKVAPVAGMSRPSQPEMQFSSNMRVSDVDFKVGDKVCVAAMLVSTRKQTKDGNMRTFEDIIVNDMVVIDRPQPELDAKEVVEALKEDESEIRPEAAQKKTFGGIEVGSKTDAE